MLDSSMFILIDFDTFYISNEIHIKNEPVVSHLRVELTTDCQNALKSSPSKTVLTNSLLPISKISLRTQQQYYPWRTVCTVQIAHPLAVTDPRISRFYIWLLQNKIRVWIPYVGYSSWNKIKKDENKSTW